MTAVKESRAAVVENVHDAYSYTTFDDLTAWLLKRLQPRRILDIGSGAGKYGQIFSGCGLQGSRLVGVEYDAHRRDALLNSGYHEVRTMGAMALLDAPAETWDLIILGDVIEHMRKSEGQDLLEFLNYRAAYILVITPEAMPMNLEPFHAGHNSLWMPAAMGWHDHWAHCRSGSMHLYLLRGYQDWNASRLRDVVTEANAQPFMHERTSEKQGPPPRVLTVHSDLSFELVSDQPGMGVFWRPQ